MTYNTALVVDDSKLARVTLRKKLEGHGLTVEFADSAADAYEKIPEFEPDIIFMDHLMPQTDGFEATKHIRGDMGIKTPIIMCTGKEHDGYLQEALAIGANQILGKPPVDEDLEAVLAMDFATGDETGPVEESVASPDASAEDDEFDMEELNQTLEAIDSLTETLTTEDGEGQPVEAGSKAAAAMAEGLDKEQVMQLIKAQLADEKQAMMTELLSAAADEQPIDEASIDRIVVDAIGKEKDQLLQEVEKLVEENTRVSDVGEKDLVARMEEILHPRLVELKSSLMSDVERKIGQGGGPSADQDITDILDLRLDVLLAERMSTIDKRLQEIEDNFQSLSPSLSDDGIPMTDESESSSRFLMSERIIKHLDQLIEENSLFARRIKQLTVLAGGALVLAAGSAAAVAVLWLG